jgi:putative transposase
VARKLKATNVVEGLCELLVSPDVLMHIRCDIGPEFVAIALREPIAAVGAKTGSIQRAILRIAIVKPSMANSATRCSKQNILQTMKEAHIVIESRGHHNTTRPR